MGEPVVDPSVIEPVFHTPVTYWLVAGERRVPVTDLFDIDGVRTIDPAAACACVALMPSGQYMVAHCTPKDLVLNGGH